LDHVGLARIDAQAFDVARRAIRHFAPAAHQARRPHRRDEDDDQNSSADVVPRPGRLAPCAHAHSAPRHLKGGTKTAPNVEPVPVYPQTLATSPSASPPETIRRVRAQARTKKFARWRLPSAAQPSKRCIMRARAFGSKLKAAGGRHGELRDFCDDSAKAAMPASSSTSRQEPG
jgi:hypothetical protein